MGKCGTGSPQAQLPRTQACPELGYEEKDLVRDAWFPSRLLLEKTGRI
jgi:hypothetical protein